MFEAQHQSSEEVKLQKYAALSGGVILEMEWLPVHPMTHSVVMEHGSSVMRIV